MTEEPQSFSEKERSYMRNYHAIRFPECKTTFKINPDLAYVLGVLWGDGTAYIQERKTGGYHYRVTLTTKSLSFAHAFKQAAQSTINTKVNQCTIKQRVLNGKTYGPYIKLETNSMPFCEWYKTKTLQDIAAEVTKVGPECAAPFIRGFFDSDGTAYFKPTTKTSYVSSEIKMVKGNLEKLERLKEMLTTLGITSVIRIARTKNPKLGWSTFYVLRIFRLKDQAIFIEKIGTNVETRKHNMTLILNHIKSKPHPHAKL